VAKICLDMSYIVKGKLSVASELVKFIENELLPETNVDPSRFWEGFDKAIHDLTPKNRKLLAIRDKMQQEIDKWHNDNKDKDFDSKAYTNFLKEIGYLVKEGTSFTIETKNVDLEISNIPGPQLVVPIMNARYALNAANARWGSFYDALYGTDVVPETEGATRGKKYNPIRGKKVIEYARNFLDENVPLANGSWKDLTKPISIKKIKLKNDKQLIGYLGELESPSSVLLKNNNLHIDIIFDPKSSNGQQDKAGIHDIILESAISSIMDHEDSVAAVDAKDKIIGYRNWLGLMKGNLQVEMEKYGKKFVRKLNSDRVYTKFENDATKNNSKIILHGRSLMLNRNVGHLMTNSSILLEDKSEVPEGIMDAFITVAAAIHDFKRKGNSRTHSVYIVKPKMHGPEEVSFTDQIFERVEDVLLLKRNTIKIGIMDEERRTTVNLKECIRATKNRVVFINTGFLDRTGDEIHTSFVVGPMIKKGEMKKSGWIAAYEDWNVDIGLSCGFSGTAQIGKGMWAMPDKMADMMQQKINHPKSGANCAWVPSPTAATLHSMHYHKINIFEVQKKISQREKAKLSNILKIPKADRPNWSVEDINKELENNAQSILGYVVRWIDQGVGCSKVPDINNVGLMEDRATLRISSQHIANWLYHKICDTNQVMEVFKKMAVIVDQQNNNDPNYEPMAKNFDKSIAFKAACDLVFKGREQPSGYTEPILHLRRLEKKSNH
tara:strand:- start:8561 stop:10726 length:2166 start_codon:yes stop_codon:yes gene_type:complete